MHKHFTEKETCQDNKLMKRFSASLGTGNADYMYISHPPDWQTFLKSDNAKGWLRPGATGILSCRRWECKQAQRLESS